MPADRHDCEYTSSVIVLLLLFPAPAFEEPGWQGRANESLQNHCSFISITHIQQARHTGRRKVTSSAVYSLFPSVSVISTAFIVKIQYFKILPGRKMQLKYWDKNGINARYIYPGDFHRGGTPDERLENTPAYCQEIDGRRESVLEEVYGFFLGGGEKAVTASLF